MWYWLLCENQQNKANFDQTLFHLFIITLGLVTSLIQYIFYHNKSKSEDDNENDCSLHNKIQTSDSLSIS